MNLPEIFSKNLKRYLEEQDRTQLELAKYLGVSNTTVNNYVKGYNMPRMDKIDKICQFFNIKRTDLIEDKTKEIDYTKIDGLIPLERATRIPILGEIACGSPIWAEENYNGAILIDNSIIKADFVLKTKGDSMIDVGIEEGDYVFLKKTPTVEDGQIAAVMIDNEATLKRVHFYDDMLVLEPCNKNYSPIIVRKEDDKTVLILGELVGVYSTKDR